MRQGDAPETTGVGWFDMSAPIITPELKRELQLLRSRAYIDPKRFYKVKLKLLFCSCIFYFLKYCGIYLLLFAGLGLNCKSEDHRKLPKFFQVRVVNVFLNNNFDQGFWVRTGGPEL
jgi:hypothetical protein